MFLPYLLRGARFAVEVRADERLVGGLRGSGLGNQPKVVCGLYIGGLHVRSAYFRHLSAVTANAKTAQRKSCNVLCVNATQAPLDPDFDPENELTVAFVDAP